MCAATRVVLAVDCGSSNLKAALFDQECRRIADCSTPVDYTHNSNGRVEFDGAMMRNRFLQVTDDVCQRAGIGMDAVTDVAFDSQAQTFAMCDMSGEPITPFYSWLDRRAADEAEEINNALGETFHEHCSLAPPIAQLQLCKMMWLKRNHPELCAAEAKLALLPGFLSWCIGAGNVADRNLAAMGGAYSLKNATWWEEALQRCGFSREQMPRLLDVGATVKIEKELDSVGFQRGTRVTLAGNDQTAGAYGNGCEKGGMVITLGTALVVYRYAGKTPGPYHEGTFWGPYPDGAFYELTTIDEGCYALDWAREQLLPNQHAAEFDELAQRVVSQEKELEAPLFFPQKLMNGNPWDNDSSKPAMAYAVLEGIGFSLRHLIEVALGAKGQAEVMTVTGGGSHSDIWLRLIACILRCPLRRGAGDPLLGAAAMALKRPALTAISENKLITPDHHKADMLEARYERWLSKR